MHTQNHLATGPGEQSAYAAGAAFIDGAMVPIGEARIPILDWGLLRSDATYDVAHVWHGRFFRLEDHIDRFERGIGKLRMRLPCSRDALREALLGCVRCSGLRDAYVEMMCTRGVPPPGSRDPRQCNNRLYAFAVPFVWIATPAQQDEGLRATISQVQRIPPASVDPTVKNYHWLDFVSGLHEAHDHGMDTTILVDHSNNVTEGPGFNVFSVSEGRIATPDRGVLQGITRQTIIELANDLGMPLSVRSVSADEMRKADELFATSTAGGVMPITVLDEAPIGRAETGPLTRRLREAYWALHEDPRFTLAVRYD